jgi:hypothetical protein
MQPEVIALLFPESPTAAAADGAPTVTALMRDQQGTMEVRRLRPDKALLRAARLAGRMNSGKPIVDPNTREIIGYEIEPMVLPAG